MDTEQFIKQTIDLPMVRNIYFGNLNCWNIILNRSLVKIPENEMVFNCNRLSEICKSVNVELKILHSFYIVYFRKVL